MVSCSATWSWVPSSIASWSLWEKWSASFPHVDQPPDLHFRRLLSCLYPVVTSNWLSASLTLHSLLPWVGTTGITGLLSVRLMLPRTFLPIPDISRFSTWYGSSLIHFLGPSADISYRLQPRFLLLQY